MRFATLAAVAALVIAPLAVVAGTPALAQAGDAKIRVAHFSPDAPAIDVYIDGKKKLTNVPYQAVSDYLALPAGNHTFDVRAAGSPATGAAVVTASQSLVAGKNYTVAAIGALAKISGKIFEDDVTPPTAGNAKVRLIHAATDVAEVDVAVKGGATIATKLALGQAGPYAELPAGAYDLEIRGTGTPTVLLAKPVTLQAGGVYTIAAVGGGDKAPTLRGFVDLAPSAVAATTIAAAATTTTIAATSATTASAATTKATTATAAATTIAAGASTTKAAATTVKPTTSAAAASRTVAPTTTVAATTTSEAATTTVDATDTTAVDATDTTAVTTDTEAEATDTTVASDTTTTKVPVGAVSTGVGDLTSGGVLVPALLLMLVAVGAVATGSLRRRGSN